MKYPVSIVLVCASIVSLASSVAYAAGDALPGEYRGDYKVTLSTGYHYSTGSYGQTEDTTIHYVPVTAKVRFGQWTGKLTVPYISITGPGVVVGDGEVTGGTPGATSTEEGLGDIVTGLSYTERLARRTYLDIGGDVKLPTADEDRGLGTGSADFTANVGLTQRFGNAHVNAKVGRKFNGDSSTTELRDVWKFSAGAGYKLTSDVSVGASYNYREGASPGSKDPSAASAYVSYRLTEDVSTQLYAGGGFSDASPDFSTGLTLSYKFSADEF